MRKAREAALYLLYAYAMGCDAAENGALTYIGESLLSDGFLVSLESEWNEHLAEAQREKARKALLERLRLERLEEEMDTILEEAVEMPETIEDETIEHSEECYLTEEEHRLAEHLFLHTLAHQAAIDTTLAQHLKSWRLSRLACIDRALLSLGTYELMFCPTVDAPLIMNDCIELAKRYGSSEKTPGLINAILDGIASEVRHA